MAADWTPTPQAPLNLAQPALVAALRERLRDVGYDAAGLQYTLGSGAEAPVKRVELPVYLRRLKRTPLHTLIKLFLLGLPAPLEDVAAAVQPLSPESLVDLGLLVVGDSGLASPYRLVVFEDLYLVCDRYQEGQATLSVDHVTGVNRSSMLLAALTVPRSGAALDLGTGCGVQALRLARHAGAVVATDINLRALNMALFNAQLNGGVQVECRAGSLFEPVAGETFDLIVSNPPYVVSPAGQFIFRDAGMEGDAISRLAVQASARHLRPGGYATVLCNWAHAAGGDWAAPLRTWTADLGCDALLLRHETSDPLTYAATWNTPTETGGVEGLGSRLDEWLAYYARLGIEAISSGAVVLRRSTGPHWTLALDAPLTHIGPCGPHLERLFAAQDFLQAHPDPADLLATVLAPTDCAVTETRRPSPDGFTVTDRRLHLIRGLAFAEPLDDFSHELLTELDGRRPLRDLLDGLDAADVEAALLTVRRWLSLGLVRPLTTPD